MKKINLDKIIYQLTIEDLQTVAHQELDRELSENEIKLIEEKIGDYIDWNSAIHDAIILNIVMEK